MEYKKEKDEEKEGYNPWIDEDGRKKKPKRGDSIPPKTNIQSRVHSKPSTDGQEYLDMYIRTKEKERTERYGEILGKQLKEVSDTWRDIKKDLLQKEYDLPKVPKGGVVEESEDEKDKKDRSKKKKPPAHMQKMDWDY